ncbi:MAG: hypothetical protein ACK4S4_04870 [Pyrinomonadaceae bacterium]
MTRKFLLLILFALAALPAVAVGQTPDPMKPTTIIGEVVAIDASGISIKTKDGQIETTLSDKTEFKRVPAETPTLKAAVASSLGDIAVGDRVVVTGIYGADRSTLPARTVYLMSKSDIAQKQARDSERWRTRGIAGRVVTVDPVGKKLSVEIRGLMGVSSVVVEPNTEAKFLRYAPDSVKYSEARPSSIAEIAPGDLIRAVGERSADGASLKAEEIISGAFQTRAGTVKSVDAAKGEIVVSDLQTKKDLTIVVSPTSVLKRFPQEFAQRFLQMQAGGAGPRPIGQPSGAAQGTPAPQGAAPSGGMQQRPGGGPGGPRGGIDEMLERFPDIAIADLKVGDTIAVSSSRNGDADRITAIKLLAGVEPFIQMAQMSAGPQRPGGRSPDINIPGLDSVGIP